MTSRREKVEKSLSVSSARIVVFCLSSLAVVWAVLMTPVFWRQSAVEGIAKHIIAGGAFSNDAMNSIKSLYSDMQPFLGRRATVLSGTAVISLRALEMAVGRGDRANLDPLMQETDDLIRRSLENSPADAFLWTVLFWLENTRGGFRSENLKYLAMAYEVGPNEGWVAIKRSRFALAMFNALTPDLSGKAIEEFSGLVRSNFLGEAADILEGPGWSVRDGLMFGLKDIDISSRKAFEKIMYQRGFNLVVPGIERPEWRPWH